MKRYINLLHRVLKLLLFSLWTMTGTPKESKPLSKILSRSFNSDMLMGSFISSGWQYIFLVNAPVTLGETGVLKYRPSVNKLVSCECNR